MPPVPLSLPESFQGTIRISVPDPCFTRLLGRKRGLDDGADVTAAQA